MTDSSLLLENRSSFEIHEMYVTPSASSSWGPNLLRGDILMPGESTLIPVECGTYDTMLVDETGAVCEILDVELCNDSADWIIRNSSCAIFEARAAAMGLEPNAE